MVRVTLVCCCLLFILHIKPSASCDVFTSTTWEAPLGWCLASTGQVFTGDFNGDGRQDMLCHSPQNGKKWIYFARCDGTFSGDEWDKNMGWCHHSGAQLFVGDFNGDGRSDMLCHDTNTGYKWVSLAIPSGGFVGTSWEHAMGWCNHSGAKLFVDDFNADGRSDMLCHDGAGKKWISSANQNGSFSGTSWELAMGWCNHAGSQLFTGDFNGDRRADLLCHDSTGKKWVALASSSGVFSGTSWENALGWCFHSGAKLYIGDFNKDRRDDMLCSDGDGYKWVAFSTPAGSFTGTDWEKDMDWCTNVDDLIVADVNGDGGDDMLCHRPSDGYKWVALSQNP